jgi:hypothetical protein
MAVSANNTIQLLTWDTGVVVYDPEFDTYFPTAINIYDSDGGSYSIPFDHNLSPNLVGSVEGGILVIREPTQGWYMQVTDSYYPPGEIGVVDAILCSQYLGGFSYPVTGVTFWNSICLGTYDDYIVTANIDEASASVSITYYDIFGKSPPITRPVFYYDATTVYVEVSNITSYGGVPSAVIIVSTSNGSYPIGAIELCPLVAPEEVRVISTYTRLDFSDGTTVGQYFTLEFDGTYYYADVYNLGLYRTKAIGTPWEMLPYTATSADTWVSPDSTGDGVNNYNLLYAAGDVALWEEIPNAGGLSTLVSADALGNTRYRTSFATYTYLQAYATNTPLFWGGNSVLLER